MAMLVQSKSLILYKIGLVYSLIFGLDNLTHLGLSLVQNLVISVVITIMYGLISSRKNKKHVVQVSENIIPITSVTNLVNILDYEDIDITFSNGKFYYNQFRDPET